MANENFQTAHDLVRANIIAAVRVQTRDEIKELTIAAEQASTAHSLKRRTIRLPAVIAAVLKVGIDCTTLTCNKAEILFARKGMKRF